MRFFVYELIDPRSGAAFYVGKGQRNRDEAHEYEARKAAKVCSEKVRKIREIWFCDLEIVRRRIAHFNDEADAYAFEAARIAEIGLQNLTNVKPGGFGSKWPAESVGAGRPRRVVTAGEWLGAVSTAPRAFWLWLRAHLSGGSLALDWQGLHPVRARLFEACALRMWNAMQQHPKVTEYAQWRLAEEK
jgi:hypothetical protein